ncbi:hypothetical protein CDES_07445 [Corynebacterium deserti GIMN1.010]|uniref:Cation-transporting P-type ATPase C-terminal domain-containing protein n=1 Tax=Corynebacterium deserti GIMN1.010 TaxID=931089 RepID=A0A0M5IM11_9CORY|nr:hypothetical protein CDES_07445 [Corynebacterium deserti GIMN1.010]
MSALQKEPFSTNPISWIYVGLMLILQLAFVYLPLMQNTFRTTALPLADWIMPVIFGVIDFLVVEIEKLLRRQSR